MVLPVSKEGNVSQQKVRETEKKPKRSFKDVMDKDQPLPQTPKWSIFDFPKHKQSPSSHKVRIKERTSSEHVQSPIENRVEIRTLSHHTGETSSISELSPAMQDLVNQMEHYVSIESQNGISTIEFQIELTDPFGPFQGTVIHINHYDTHPHSFNILLMNPKESAVDELTAHLPTLLKALQTKLEHFQINLLPPAFTQLEKPKSLRKIDRAFKAEKKEERKTREIKRNPFLN